MSQYFENNENLEHKYKTINYTYKNKIFSFITDAGIFSKERVDFGTNVLINNLVITEHVKKVLDIGTGYGVLGILIATANKKVVVDMVDINKAAVDLAYKNAKANAISNVNIYESNLYDNVNKMFDLIVSNPPIRAGKAVVHKIFIDGKNHLNESGEIWVVIQKKQGAPSLEKKMLEVYGNCEIIAKQSGYFILRSRNSST